jgi:hypothetical protein
MHNKVILLLFAPCAAFSQTLGREDAHRFAEDLIRNPPLLSAWFEPGDIRISHRLGIEYEGVPNKNLIGYDIDDTTRARIENRLIGYSVVIDSLGLDYSRLTLTSGDSAHPRAFYFKGRKCVSPLAYFSRDWTMEESTFFRFYLSDPGLTNAYCQKRLDTFVTQMAELLGIEGSGVTTLRQQKITYYLCKNEDEIERLTGYRVRGMYNLAYDAVITTYNCHLHELLHLLMNFKLGHLPLYTHPFLQEGFAVAYGGRGGLESGVFLSPGRFLFQNQLVDLTNLLTADGFRQFDPSLTYPASGLYTRFLVMSYGMPAYLQLYRNHSSTHGTIDGQIIDHKALPPDSLWNRYLADMTSSVVNLMDTLPARLTLLTDDKEVNISEDSERYYFQLSHGVALRGTERFPGYKSRAFKEALPANTYSGEKYLILATADDISVYNLFTNTLIASYSAGFSQSLKKVPKAAGRYSFWVSKRIFDEPLDRVIRAQGFHIE